MPANTHDHTDGTPCTTYDVLRGCDCGPSARSEQPNIGQRVRFWPAKGPGRARAAVMTGRVTAVYPGWRLLGLDVRDHRGHTWRTYAWTFTTGGHGA